MNNVQLYYTEIRSAIYLSRKRQLFRQVVEIKNKCVKLDENEKNCIILIYIGNTLYDTRNSDPFCNHRKWCIQKFLYAGCH